MSDGEIPPVSSDLIEAMVIAYPRYVREQVGRFGVEGGLDRVIVEGARWLEEQLRELLGKPFPAQRRAPLELFQEAMKYPTAMLAEAGCASVARDDVTAAALPGDLYDLAPASTRDLGEELWALHLRWGAAKAAAIKPLL